MQSSSTDWFVEELKRAVGNEGNETVESKTPLCEPEYTSPLWIVIEAMESLENRHVQQGKMWGQSVK